MEWAKSILYGGMILNAKEADYKSSERLILVCPICGEAVYLVKGHNRAEHARMSPKSKEIVLVKESVIPNSFAHFHGVAENCELKSKSINQNTIQSAIATGRGQRLRFIQRRFGQIAFSETIEENKTIKHQMTIQNPFTRDKQIEEMLNNLQESISNCLKIKDIKIASRMILDTAITEPEKKIINVEKEKLLRRIKWLNSLELDLHIEIVQEVMSFLLSKSGYPCLIKSMDYGLSLLELSYPESTKLLSLHLAHSKEELETNYYHLVEGISSGIIAFISGITWANAIAEYNKEKRGE
jgi:hypothetical protein